MRIFVIAFFFSVSFSCSGQDLKFKKSWLLHPEKYSGDLEESFGRREITRFIPHLLPDHVLMQNGYASALINNPGSWKHSNAVIVDTVNIIFTSYPPDKNFWLTNYYYLLSQRLQNLFNLDSMLNSSSVTYNLVLQTGCKTEEEAKEFFHGIEIVFHPKSLMVKNDSVVTAVVTEPTQTVIPPPHYADAPAESKRITSFINSNGGLIDSTVMRVLQRNRQWKNALVIMDWTGSMYQYGGQAVLWHSLNFKTSGLKYFVFFNDGDNKRRKPVGKTGGIYFEKGDNLKRLVNLLNRVKMKGNGGDTEENDAEAIIKGIRKFSGFTEVILIADNNSCIRDFCLLHEITFPVKVILCGTYSGINPQFLNLAYRTGGSIHTIEEDIYDLYTRKKSDASFMIDGTEYHFDQKKDLFEYNLKPDKDDPHFCEKFYRKKKCKCDKL